MFAVTSAIGSRLGSQLVKAIFHGIFVVCPVRPAKKIRVNRKYKGSGVQLVMLISDVDQVFDINLDDLVIRLITRCVTRAALSTEGAGRTSVTGTQNAQPRDKDVNDTSQWYDRRLTFAISFIPGGAERCTMNDLIRSQ